MSAPRKKFGAPVEFIARSCEGKRRLPDEITARAVGQHMGERSGDKLFVYRCRFCRGWHLTKNARLNREQDAVDFYTKPKPGKEMPAGAKA